MEAQGAERSTSPSGSEDMESDDDSKHEDEVDNEKDSEEENDKEEAEEDSDSDDSDQGGEEGSENSSKSEPGEVKIPDDRKYSKDSGDSVHESESYGMDGECYPMADLPLEVITTVEPTNYSYPVLKNMSNGVLTHRNIFTEHERSVLVNIINKYRDIVDTRSRTREIYVVKQNVWQQIVEEYNSTDNIMLRTEKELRKCWDNMKYRAKQAEKEMVKVKVEDGAAQVNADAPEIEIKMEPVDQDDARFPSDEEEPGDDNEAANEDEREPALKRARQESPKLSSLLLAGSHKRSVSKKISKNDSGTTHKSSSGSFPYNIPTCTKVLQVKKKSHSGSLTSVAASNNTSLSEIPILPKGLASCLSITNIPNPISVVNHVGGSFGSHVRDSSLSNNSSGQASMKPMPSLKKMVPSKHQGLGSSKSSNIHRSRKTFGGHSSKVRGHSSNSSSHNTSLGHSANSVNNISALQCIEEMLSPSHTDIDNDRSEVSERQLSAKLATQRLEFERREHELRVRLLEKELETQRYQSQYWSLKLKMLRSGRETATFNFAGATNGDID